MRGIHFERAVSRGRVVLVFGAMLVLASCLQRGANKAAAPVTPAAPKPVAHAPAPAPPVPPPLSIPQTQVALPPPQPIDPAALVTESASQDAQQPATRPAAGPRRAPVPPVVTPAPAPAEPPPPATRNPIQEIISSAEVKRLQDQAQGRRRQVNQILEQLGKRSLPRTQQSVVKSILSFLTLSEEAEKRNDMRQADALAERAQILALDLQNGK